MLLGSRREFRPIELVAQPLMQMVGPLMFGQWARFRAIDAATVAAAMYGVVRSRRRGLYRYTYTEIGKFAVNAKK